jgi:hypothetical protein
MTKIKQVEAIFFSDVHLGSKGSNNKRTIFITNYNITIIVTT